MNKLILLPLAILAVLSICSMLGLGDTILGEGQISIDIKDAVYYDIDGNAKVYVANLTCVTGDQPFVIGNYFKYAVFMNETGFTPPVWALFYDSSATLAVEYEDLGKVQDSGVDSIDMNTSIGLIILVTAIMAVAALVGLRVLGSGVSETSVATILTGTAFLTVWGIFSVLALDLILEMALLGPILYFALTILYTLGIIIKIGGSDE